MQEMTGESRGVGGDVGAGLKDRGKGCEIASSVRGDDVSGASGVVESVCT